MSPGVRGTPPRPWRGSSSPCASRVARCASPTSERERVLDLAAHTATFDVAGQTITTVRSALPGLDLAALVLAGLYAVLNDTVMPTVTERIQEMFDYAG